MSAPPVPRNLEQRIRLLWSELFDQRDFGKARAWWSERSADHFLALGSSARGPVELEAFFRRFLDAFSELRMVIERVVAQDAAGLAAVQWRATGTTSGRPFQGIKPPPGLPVELRGCDVFQLDEEGRVLENTVYFDGAEFARQLGMLPARGSTLDRATLLAFNARSWLRRQVSSSRSGGNGRADRY